jgi:magnesium chelatase family protein
VAFVRFGIWGGVDRLRGVLAHVQSFVLQGIEASACEIEVDAAERGIARTTIVGLPDASVRESIERVRSALTNSGYPFPCTRLLVNLAPADVPKIGPVYDLPIAIGLLLANGTIESGSHLGIMFAGELSLDGRVRPIRGTISLAMLARQLGVDSVIVPKQNVAEAAAVEGVRVLGAERLSDVVAHLNGHQALCPTPVVHAVAALESANCPIDFGDIRGQESVKRAVTVAAAGGHNLLMIGPAGTGKTMMAKALPGILPPMTRAEALETTRIWSAAGLIPSGRPLMTRRPVRTPHHTASAAALIGGGTIPGPGEVSLAHHGILFLDETPEFSRSVLETLRQPLEDGVVTIARVQGTFRFPARFMLVAAMNPTPGGHFATDEVSARQMDRYMARVSGPLLDRIDIHVEVPRVRYEQLSGPRSDVDTARMRDEILAARQRQAQRQGPGASLINAALSGRQLDQVAAMGDAAANLMRQAITELGLSARAYDKIRRLSRTIADLAGSDDVEVHHVGEAIQYRLLDRQAGLAAP